MEEEEEMRHGMSGTRLHRVWCAMRQRCENPDNPGFHNYGGRGIAVCERWQEFINFAADMGPHPDEGKPGRAGWWIDRINNDGDYAPDNCRWATPEQQSLNRRNNIPEDVRAKRKTVDQIRETMDDDRPGAVLRAMRKPHKGRCKYCNKRFVSTDARSIYCSPKCRNRAWREAQK